MKRFIALLAVVFAASTANAQNIVQNGDFENGSANWTMTNFGIYGFGGSNTAGTGCVSNGCVSTQGQGAFISQSLATDVGTSYSLSFAVGEDSGPTSEMSIFWNGVLVADVVNPANNSTVTFTYDNLVATGTSTVLEVHGRQDPAGIYFDNFAVTAAVPEPSSYAMLFAGLGLMGLIARRRKN